MYKPMTEVTVPDGRMAVVARAGELCGILVEEGEVVGVAVS